MPVENDSSISQVRHFLRELLLGREDPEGFFCLCLSILGHRETQVRFRELISPLTDGHRQLHSLLLIIYQEYFSKDEDDELELALALSLVKTNQTSTPQPVARTYAQQASGTSVVPAKGHTHVVDTTQKIHTYVGKSPDVPKTPKGPREPVTIKTASIETKEGAKATSSLANNSDILEKLDADDQSDTSRKSRRRRQRKNQQQLLKSPSSPRPILLWFRRDLRLIDNPALIGCLELGAPVIPLFLWNDQEEEGPGVTVAAGGACKYWLHQALICLNQALERIGSHLVTLKAEPSSAEVLQRLVKETGAGTVVATALYEPWLKERDEGVFNTLKQQGVSCHLHHSYCLRDPYTITTQGVGLRGIGSVSHFMSCCQQNPTGSLGAPLDAPHTLPVPSTWPTRCQLAQLGLARMPRRKDGTTVDWAVNIRRDWDFTEEGGHARLEAFLQDGVTLLKHEHLGC